MNSVYSIYNENDIRCISEDCEFVQDSDVEVVREIVAPGSDRIASSSSSRYRHSSHIHSSSLSSSSSASRARYSIDNSRPASNKPRYHSRWDYRSTNNSVDSRSGDQIGANNGGNSLDEMDMTNSSTAQLMALQQMQQLDAIQHQQQQLDAIQQQQQQSQQWGMMYPMVPLSGDPSMMASMMLPTAMAFNQFSFLGAADASTLPLAAINDPNGVVLPLLQSGVDCSDHSLNPMSGDASQKEIIHCKSCTLFPPTPGTHELAVGEKPPGCRTVFVGGLPESAKEDIVLEIFERCGEITTVRMSRKNFCHIRFKDESSVENALYLAGYRIRIGSNTDVANTGRLHIDYAQARDDFYEWECRQRQSQREQRHRERQESRRPHSPPPVAHYSDHEASTLADNLKAIPNMPDESGSSNVGSITNEFYKAVQTLATWLDRGDCTKRNSVQFYAMIQCTNGHIRRLASEKSQVEEELHRAKEKLRQQVNGILIQFNLIEKVFMAASHQKVWDHFTKAQRKSIDMWKKQAQAIKEVHLQDALNERVEDEMDLSDDEGEGSDVAYLKGKDDEDAFRESAAAMELKLNSLQDENDSLRCQLEAYKNEVEILKVENCKESDDKDKQTRSLRQALQGMQQQLIQVNQQRMKDEEQLNELKRNMDEQRSSQANNDDVVVATQPVEHATTTKQKVVENDAKMICLLAAFLNVHPFGASIDYIWSYLQRLNNSLQPSDVEALLLKFPSVFKQELSGIGANLERKWRFTGFET